MKIVALTDKGLIRQENQDSFCTNILSENDAFAVVCDGMGGNRGGKIASKMAIETICREISKGYTPSLGSKEVQNLLLNSTYFANRKIFSFSLTHGDLFGMGTTLALAFVQGNIFHIINIGDSRTYIISKSKIRQITKDHSMVQELVECGQLTSTQARSHPNKNIITRALGIRDYVEADYYQVPIKDGEKVFLCTDGFSNYIDEDKIVQLVQNTPFENLAVECVNCAKEKGGNDNITVVAIEK